MVETRKNFYSPQTKRTLRFYSRRIVEAKKLKEKTPKFIYGEKFATSSPGHEILISLIDKGQELRANLIEKGNNMKTTRAKSNKRKWESK